VGRYVRAEHDETPQLQDVLTLIGVRSPKSEVCSPVPLPRNGVCVFRHHGPRWEVEDVQVPVPPNREPEFAVARSLTPLLPVKATHAHLVGSAVPTESPGQGAASAAPTGTPQEHILSFGLNREGQGQLVLFVPVIRREVRPAGVERIGRPLVVEGGPVRLR
jgi:hypothetical protein